MEHKIISLKDVKTPKTVEEFRENLRKYFHCYENPKNTDHLYFKDEKNDQKEFRSVKIDQLNSLDDLYEFQPEPQIVPMVKFYDQNNCKIFTSQNDFFEEGYPTWFKIDSHKIREFLVKTLGDFSGYETDQN